MATPPVWHLWKALCLHHPICRRQIWRTNQPDVYSPTRILSAGRAGADIDITERYAHAWPMSSWRLWSIQGFYSFTGLWRICYSRTERRKKDCPWRLSWTARRWPNRQHRSASLSLSCCRCLKPSPRYLSVSISNSAACCGTYAVVAMLNSSSYG